MAASTFTTQTGSGEGLSYLFKRVYGPRVSNLFARQQQTWNLFKKSNRKASARPGGEGFYFVMRQADVESVAARLEGQYLPEPIRGDGVQGYIKPASMYGRLRMSGLSIAASKGNAMSVVNGLGDQTASVYKAMINDLNRQCHGDGHGKLATVDSDATYTQQTDTGYYVGCNNDLGLRYIRKNMIIDIYTSGGVVDTSAKAVGLQVDYLDYANARVYIKAAATYVNTYHPNSTLRGYTPVDNKTISAASQLVRSGVRDAAFATTDTAPELTGILGHFDDGTLLATYQGVTVASDPEVKAHLVTNSSVNRELSIDLMLAAMDIGYGRSGYRPNVMMMGLGQRRKYFGLLAPDIRYSNADYIGGYERLRFAQDAQVGMLVDPHCQPNAIFFLPDGAIKKYVLDDIGWGGFDPNKMHWRENYDEADMYLRMYANLGCEQRSALVKLGDLTEPTTTYANG